MKVPPRARFSAPDHECTSRALALRTKGEGAPAPAPARGRPRRDGDGVILRSGRAPSRSFIFHAAPAGRPRVAPLTARSAAYADGCSRSERPKSYKIRAQTLPDMLCRNAEKRYKITAHSSQACCCCAPLVEWLYVWSGLPIHCHGLLPQSTHTGVGDVLDVRGHGHACR
jgi:hypothetical protein